MEKNAHDTASDVVAPIVPVAFALLPNLDDLLVEQVGRNDKEQDTLIYLSIKSSRPAKDLILDW